MKFFCKRIPCLLLILFLASCSIGNPEENETEETLLVYLDDELYTGETIDLVEDDSIELTMNWTGGSTSDFTLIESSGLDITRNPLGISYTIEPDDFSVTEAVLYIYDSNGIQLLTINFNIIELPYMIFNAYSFDSTVIHGESVELGVISNIENPDSVEIGYSEPGIASVSLLDNFEGLTINALQPGEVTISVSYIDDPTVEDEVLITIEPREVSFQVESLPEILWVGDTLDLGSILSITYTTSPTLYIGEPSQDVTYQLTDSFVSISDSVVTGIDEGISSLDIISSYNEDCSQSIDISVLGSATGLTLSGTIIDGPGSYGLSGSMVELYSFNSETLLDSSTTIADGSFNFTGLDSGFYDIAVSGNGRAASTLVHIVLTDESRHLDIVQKEVDSSVYPTEAPEIETDSANIMVISDTTVFQASIGSGSVVLANGGRFSLGSYIVTDDGSPQMLNAVSEDTFNIEIQPQWLTDQFQEVSIVAYDINNNRCEYRIPLMRKNNSPAISYVPGDTTNEQIDIYTVTYGQAINTYTAQNDSYHSVMIAVEEGYSSNGIDGIMVYRSTTNGDLGSAIGSSSSLDSGTNLGVKSSFVSSYYDWFYYQDRDSDLETATTYYYSVAYIKDGIIGEASSQVALTILPPYTLELLSPADNSSVSGIPTFTWQEVKDTSLWSGITYDSADRLILLAADDLSYIDSPDPITDGTYTFTLPDSLLSNIRYQWDIISYRYIEESSTYSHSYSESLPRSPVYSSLYYQIFGATLALSNNGSYSFYQE